MLYNNSLKNIFFKSSLQIPAVSVLHYLLQQQQSEFLHIPHTPQPHQICDWGKIFNLIIETMFHIGGIAITIGELIK